MVDSAVIQYGTNEEPQAFRTLKTGGLSLLYSPEGLRRISWKGTELVRAITWPIRDTNWGTYPPENVEQIIDETEEATSGQLSFSVANGKLACKLRFHISESGEIRVDISMSPTDGSFATNRAGLTVLHPIRGVEGKPLLVTHSDGSREETEFPRRISPDQPVKDISGLHYSVDGNDADIAFVGEVFEMEDQRNWSDASYKTYCVPLVHPFVYEITDTVTQTIVIRLNGSDAKGAKSIGNPAVTLSESDNHAPSIGLAIESGWNGNAQARDLAAGLNASHLLVRMGPEVDAGFLADITDLAKTMSAKVDAEIVLPDEDDVASALRAFDDAFKASEFSPTRVIALRSSYLGSHQPSGPWPKGPSPSEVCATAREIWPGALIGGGMLTNFTELNRCRPDPALCDYITHSNTAIVHAGDDLSVIETLETLPQIFDSARVLNQGKPYRLGLVSIGMRTNPYGAAIAENPQQIRRTMAREDPRHRGLFGAAWAVGVLATTENSGLEALCLGAPTGPFGLVYQKQDYPQAGYDDSQGLIYPIFHVVREACNFAGAARYSVNGLAEGIAGYAVKKNGEHRMIIANISGRNQSVDLDRPGSVAVLNSQSFSDAIGHDDWLETTQRHDLTQVELEPFAVAFITRTI